MALREISAMFGVRIVLAALVIMSCSFASGGDVSRGGQQYKVKREDMVKTQLAGRDIIDPEVLRAMGAVPRHAFIPEALRDEAYADWALPIGYDQTISQPYIVAYMTQALGLKQGARVLEIGTGSGYQAAVLAELGLEVYTIEIVPELGKRAAGVLKHLGYKVHTRIGDGYDGWKAAAPFDGILVTAAPPGIPRPLIRQLREKGRLVVPVGRFQQTLKVFTKVGGKLVLKNTLPVRFVPMTGKIDEQNAPPP